MLTTIVDAKRIEIADRREGKCFEELLDEAPAGVPSLAAQLQNDRVNIIAEIKYRSPSHGPFLCQDDPQTIAAGYISAGAAALSILTDFHFFGGRPEFLQAVYQWMREGYPDPESAEEEKGGGGRLRPILRKDFILDRYQLAEARAWGASAVLLIVACLSRGDLRSLRRHAEEMGLEALVEVHDLFELETAVESGATMIGVNNRNLKNFDVDVKTSFEMARRLEGEDGLLLVSESGLKHRSQLDELRDAGFDAFLVGTAFMDRDCPGEGLKQLLEGGAK